MPTVKHQNQAGQTLIETVVAIFILIMGVSSALGLALYSLNASSNISKQIIAVGLAREGLEAVKNMRDTNWLKDLKNTSCYDYITDTEIASCYQNWLDATSVGGFNIKPEGGLQTYRLKFISGDSGFWTLENADNGKYGLDLGTDDINETGIYTFPSGGTTNGTSDFYRKITIQEETALSPYKASEDYSVLIVTSQVWWKDKSCPASSDYPSSGRCAVTLQTYLTNWKNY